MKAWLPFYKIFITRHLSDSQLINAFINTEDVLVLHSYCYSWFVEMWNYHMVPKIRDTLLNLDLPSKHHKISNNETLRVLMTFLTMRVMQLTCPLYPEGRNISSLYPHICSFIYLFVYLSIHSSIHLSIYLLIYLSIYRCTLYLIFLSTYQSIYSLIYLSIYLSIRSSIYLSTYLSIYLSIYLFIYLSIHLSICLSICSFIYLSKGVHYVCISHLSIHISIHLSILLFIHLSISIC